MKVASLLGLSLGWALTALTSAISVGFDDPLFWPSLAVTLPAVVGLFGALRAQRTRREPLAAPRLIGFALVGALVATAAVLAMIAGIYRDRPVPGEELDPANGVIVDDQ